MTIKTPIPHAALTQHIIALGKTGSGKSSKLRVLVEALLELNAPVCIIDPKGDWWGLKSSADGKRSGFPIVIFGGEHADVPLNPHAGAQVAELVATGNRSCLVDLGGWMVGDRTRFFIDFASTLFKLTRGSRHLVIDEVHNFAPQGKILDVDAGKMLHWANRLASEGRGKGLTIIAASQRPQKVHKDFLTSCETLIAGRVIHKLDRDAIKDWIDGCADPAKGREVLASLAQMKRPEAWCWSPEIDFGPELVTFPMFRTYDSFKPQAADAGKLAGWAEVDLDQVKAKLATVVEEAKKNDPAALRKCIVELEQQLRAKSAEGPRGYSKEHLNEACNRAESEGHARGYTAGVATLALHVQQKVNAALDANDSMLDALEAIVAAVKKQPKHAPAGARAENPVRRVQPEPPQVARKGAESEPALAGARARQIDARAPSSSSAIGAGGKRRMLTALAQYPEGMTTRRLSIITDIAQGGGTWRTYMAELRAKDWIRSNRDHHVITDEGLKALGAWDPLPTGQALRDYWRSRLGDTGKRKIFDVVVEAYPESVTQEFVSGRTGIAIGGGTWRTYLAELRGLELIEGRGELRASEDLFN